MTSLTGSGVTGRCILLIANNFPPVRGGSAAVYANLAQCAPERIVVVAPRIGYADGLPLIGWRESDRRRPYRVIRLPLLRTRMSDGELRGAARLRFLLGDAAIRLRLAGVVFWLVLRQRIGTVCVGELAASGWIARLASLWPGLRVVTYVHGEEITTEDLYDHGHRRARRALLASDRIVVVSRFTERAVADLLGPASARRVSLIENGVDTERFCPRPRLSHLVELYRLGGCFTFVSVCRLVEKKGIDHAIRAFAQVAERDAGSRFLVVGTGPQQPALEGLVEELGLARRVIFAGQVADEELADHYRLGDVFVMPNRELPNGDTEGFGLVFLEANACGLPVVAGRDGGSPDAVQDGVNGLLVDGRSVDEIARAMLRLHGDTALRDRLRQHGLAVAARSGWAGKARAFLTLCDAPARQHQARQT